MMKLNRKDVLPIVFVGVLAPLTPQSASAQDSLSNFKEALGIIADYADRTCKDIPLEGRTDSLELSGRAKVELSEIIKKIAGLEIAGAAKYQNSDYRNVLQKDLAKAISDSNSCKLKVLDTLNDILRHDKISGTPFRPNPPSQLMVQCIRGKGYLLTWLDNSINELGFNVYRWSDGEQQRERRYSLRRTVSSDAIQYVDEDYWDCRSPYVIAYQVAAYNETGESARIQYEIRPALPSFTTGP
jgi:hypothetical protein